MQAPVQIHHPYLRTTELRIDVSCEQSRHGGEAAEQVKEAEHADEKEKRNAPFVADAAEGESQ